MRDCLSASVKNPTKFKRSRTIAFTSRNLKRTYFTCERSFLNDNLEIRSCKLKISTVRAITWILHASLSTVKALSRFVFSKIKWNLDLHSIFRTPIFLQLRPCRRGCFSSLPWMKSIKLALSLTSPTNAYYWLTFKQWSHMSGYTLSQADTSRTCFSTRNNIAYIFNKVTIMTSLR